MMFKAFLLSFFFLALFTVDQTAASQLRRRLGKPCPRDFNDISLGGDCQRHYDGRTCYYEYLCCGDTQGECTSNCFSTAFADCAGNSGWMIAMAGLLQCPAGETHQPCTPE